MTYPEPIPVLKRRVVTPPPPFEDETKRKLIFAAVMKAQECPRYANVR